MRRAVLRFEHRVLQHLREIGLITSERETGARQRWLLAVSGGLDSMVLAEVIWRWRRLLRVDLIVGHVHHGTDGANSPFRDASLNLVRGWCKAHHVRFLATRAQPRGLRSEASLRDYRLRTLARWRKTRDCRYIVLAHHADDLLETRLLRLIRGVGRQGLQAMEMTDGIKLRPLLPLSRREIEEYAVARGLVVGEDWLEDPTNKCPQEALRNWLRETWLPQLEKRQRGALKVLARSLETIMHSSSPSSSATSFTGPLTSLTSVAVLSSRSASPVSGLRREGLAGLKRKAQEQAVAAFLKDLGARGYGQTHVRELLKRIARGDRASGPIQALGQSDPPEQFVMLGFCFRVTPDLLWASRV